MASSSTRTKKVAKRTLTDSALVRRPLSRYRPTALNIRRQPAYARDGDDSDEYDYEDNSPDYHPPSSTEMDTDEGSPVKTYVKRESQSPPVRRSERIATRKTAKSSTSTKRKGDVSPQKAKKSRMEPVPKPVLTTVSNLKETISSNFKSIMTPSTTTSNQNQGSDNNVWGELIPMEVLFRIFRFALCDETTIHLLPKIEKVCHLWNKVASLPDLWSTVDLSYLKDEKPAVVLAGLAKYAQGIRDLSFSRWQKLQIVTLEEFLRQTREIRALNVSFCRSLDLRRLLCEVVPEYCPKLTSLDLSYVDPTCVKRITSILRLFLPMETGRQLEILHLNGNAMSDLRILFAESALSKATENIRILNLSRVCSDRRNSRKIRLVDFVQAFPNLEVLDMTDAMLDFTCKPAEEQNDLVDVWSNLRECKLGTTAASLGYQSSYDIFIRLLGRCKNLRRLDLSGLCIYDRLIWLRETPLTNLTLNRVREMAKNAVTIDFFSTWGRSLETLCIAWVIGYVESLCSLFATAKKCGFTPRLKCLDLTGTCVTASQLRILLDVCESLEFVDVQSCRGMPLGMKRAFDGVEAIQALRERLQEIENVG